MSDRVGSLSFDMPQPGEMAITKPYSEQTAQVIDEEVRAMVKSAYDHTFKLLTAHKEDVERVKLRHLLVVFINYNLYCLYNSERKPIRHIEQQFEMVGCLCQNLYARKLEYMFGS